MKLYIGLDHGAMSLKNDLLIALTKLGYSDIFLSTIENNSLDDYPDFAFDVCSKMDKENDIAVLICTTGIGMSIAANKVKGVRCARVVSEMDAKTSRAHNGANAIALSVELGLDKILFLIDTFIKEELPKEERHQRRVQKIIDYENGAYNEL